MPTDLDVEVRTGLERRRGDWPRIADLAGVSHSWVSQFVRRKIPNPGFETLKRIRDAMNTPGERKPQAHTGDRRSTKRPANDHGKQAA